MTTTDTTALAYQLKRVYGNTITDLFARQKMTYNLFLKSNRQATVAPAGVGYYYALRQSDNQAVGGRGEGQYLPEPLYGAGVQGVITPRLLYAALRLSGLAIEVGKTNVAAFVNTQGDAISSTYKALINDLNRQCHGDGYGLIGTLSAAATLSTTNTWTGTFDNDMGTRYMKKGMIVDFYNGTAIDQSAITSRILSINPTTRVVTFEANGAAYQAYHPLAAARAYTIADGAIANGSTMVRYGARAAAHATTNPQYEIMGLLGMYDDATLLASFQGVTIATYPEFVANILANGGTNRELSIDLMLSAMDLTAARSDRQVSLMRLGLGQRRKYFALLEPSIRYQPGVLVGGYEKLTFTQNGAVSMIIDPQTQPNRVFFEPEGVVRKYELTPIGWGGFDSNKMHWRQDYDEATMFLRTYTNLGVEERNALTLLKDLTEPTNNPF